MNIFERTFLFIVALSSIFGWCLFSHQVAQARTDISFRYLPMRIHIMPEADAFEFQFRGVPVRGVRVGDPAAPAVLFTGGYGSSILAYRMWIRFLANQGLQVFAFNTPGFGHNELRSYNNQKNSPVTLAVQFGAYEALIRQVYEMTEMPVVISGHSLGGIQSRLATLGIRTGKDGVDRINKKAAAELKEMVRLVMPLMSPSTVLLDDLTTQQMVQMKVGIFALTRLVPSAIDLHQYTPRSIRTLQGYFQSTVFGRLEWLMSGMTDQFLGVDDMNFSEYATVYPYAVSDDVPDFLPAMMRKWEKEMKATTEGGLDFGQAWLKQQSNPDTRIPTVMFIGSKDKIADVPALESETAAISAGKVMFESGHIGSMLSPSHAKIIASVASGRWYESDFENPHWLCASAF